MKSSALRAKLYCLNPYSIGRYSMSKKLKLWKKKEKKRLNPYSIGRYSMSLKNIKFSFLTDYHAYKSKRPPILFKKQVLSKGLQSYK